MSITIYFSITSSPSTPRAALAIPENGTSPSELRRKASDLTLVPLSSMKLIFRGRVIPDKDGGDVVKDFKLENESVIHVMGKPVMAENGAAAGGAAGGAAASTTSLPAGASVTLPSTNSNAASSARASSSPLNAALTKLRSSNDGPTYRTALTTVSFDYGVLLFSYNSFHAHKLINWCCSLIIAGRQIVG
jgi:hypothetical protein